MDGARELALLATLELQVRADLYSIGSTYGRSKAVCALAAAAASRAYLRSDALPEWQNPTSDLWRVHLGDVWRHLEGDESAHHRLSIAIADHLASPLNNTEGQDGPADFDLPQTLASYCAAASVVFWGVDFASTAVGQIFDLIDLQFDAEYPPERAAEVEAERLWVTIACATIVEAAAPGGGGLTSAVLAGLRS